MQLTRAIEERYFSITCRRWNSRPYQNIVASLSHPSASSPHPNPTPRVCVRVYFLFLYFIIRLHISRSGIHSHIYIVVASFTNSALSFLLLVFFLLLFLAVFHLVACIHYSETPYSNIYFGRKKSSSTRPIKVENYITSYSLFISGIKRFTIYLCFYPFLLFFLHTLLSLLSFPV